MAEATGEQAEDLNNPFLLYDDVKNGGSLVSTMGPKPSQWGTKPQIPN